MMPFIATAAVLGAVGTFHCIGMCGPLALALPVVNEAPASRLLSSLLYNVGRTFTYAVLGAALGLIGHSFSLAGFQQVLSVIAGCLIIIMIALPLNRTGLPFLKDFFMQVRKQLGMLFSKKSYSANFSIGLLNGLLPCGLVYVALAAAVATGNLLSGAAFMAAFGLGTLPVMWGLAFFGSYIQPQRISRLKKLYPVLMFGMGVLLILRGMGLDIPLLSPAFETRELHTPIYCHQ